jgi:hypothetical protein
MILTLPSTFKMHITETVEQALPLILSLLPSNNFFNKFKFLHHRLQVHCKNRYDYLHVHRLCRRFSSNIRIPIRENIFKPHICKHLSNSHAHFQRRLWRQDHCENPQYEYLHVHHLQVCRLLKNSSQSFGNAVGTDDVAACKAWEQV